MPSRDRTTSNVDPTSTSDLVGVSWTDFRTSRERYLKRLQVQHEIHQLEAAWLASDDDADGDSTNRARS